MLDCRAVGVSHPAPSRRASRTSASGWPGRPLFTSNATSHSPSGRRLSSPSARRGPTPARLGWVRRAAAPRGPGIRRRALVGAAVSSTMRALPPRHQPRRGGCEASATCRVCGGTPPTDRSAAGDRRTSGQRRGRLAPRTAARRPAASRRRGNPSARARGADAAAAGAADDRARVTRAPSNRDRARAAALARRPRDPAPADRTTRTSGGLPPQQDASTAPAGRRDDLRLARSQPIARVPQPPARPGPSAPRGRRADPPRPAVIRSSTRHRSPVGVVARDLLQPGVDDGGHAGHGQRRLGDVRGENHAAPPTGRSARSCASASSEPCSGTRSRRGAAESATSCSARLISRRARQEAQHVARSRASSADAPPRRLSRRGTRSRADAAGPAHRRAGSRRETPHRRRVERRRHHDDPQIVARPPGLPRQREPEIGVHAALVELVEDDGAEAGEQRILLR